MATMINSGKIIPDGRKKMSKAIVKIDIQTDYADEYKEWLIEGRLCYLEDNAWTHLKDIECEVELYKDAIPIDYIEKWIDARSRIIKINPPAFRELLATKLLDDWLAGREPDWPIKFEVE